MIELVGIAKSYGALTVLNKIDLLINKGTFIAIYGPSGSGKTTLLNIIGTIDDPDDGQVIIDEVNITQSSEQVINRIRANSIGFAHQSCHMIGFLPVEENISLPLRLKGCTDNGNLVKQMLEQLALESKGKNKPGQLSYGEKKRASIARALINNPDIIIVDEPTANLDADNRKRVLNILAERAKAGSIVVVATHDETIRDYAHQVVKLENGQLF